LHEITGVDDNNRPTGYIVNFDDYEEVDETISELLWTAITSKYIKIDYLEVDDD
tara:strand:- start:225 stop:386 length:162 start_codon:yes stop_codon:yes gene_type:complete